jgi:hypothetical protein
MGLVETSKNGSVTFLHRTVLEWVTRPENLTAIKRDASTAFNPNLELFKARTTEASAAPVTTSGQRFRQLLKVCLSHASLASHRPEDKERLVQTFERLESYTTPLTPYLSENLIYKVASFAIVPLVMAKVDKAAFRSKFPLSYEDLLESVVIGQDQWEARLEILTHLLRVAPHNWAKRRALEEVIRHVRKSLVSLGSASSSVGEGLEMDYLVDVEAVLQRELSLHVWIYI